MANPNRLNIPLSTDKTVEIFNRHEFPAMACPYCSDLLHPLITETDEGEGRMVALTCGCAKWEMLEQALALEDLEETPDITIDAEYRKGN